MKNEWMKTIRGAVVLSVCVLLVSACGDEGGDTGDLEIEGSYTDDFNGSHTIGADTWSMDGAGLFHIDTFDNDERYLIAQNDSDNDFNPDLWSRMDWAWDGDALFFCQSVFDAESAEAAESAEPADGEDLDAGCGGFPWSSLTPK